MRMLTLGASAQSGGSVVLFLPARLKWIRRLPLATTATTTVVYVEMLLSLVGGGGGEAVGCRAWSYIYGEYLYSTLFSRR